MISEARCFGRSCRHLIGIEHLNKEDDSDEASQVWVCPAFPRGIPNDIAYQDNLHMEPDPRQEDGTEAIVYERLEGEA